MRNIRLLTIIIIYMTIINVQVFAQNLGIGPDTFDPDPSAGVEMQFTDKGLLIPRVALTSTSSPSPITSPATSLLIYNTATAGDVTPGYYYWTSSKWMRLLAIDDKHAWLLSGNAGTTPGTNFIGTMDAKDVVFKTNSTEIMRITSGGNVGIGTTNPAEKLDINGSVRGNQSGALRINTGYGYIDIGPKNNNWAHFYTDKSRYWFSTGLTIETGNIGSYDEDLSVQTSGTTRITILNSNGNVGIGTTTPAQKLNVNGNVLATSFKGTGNYQNIWGSWGNSIWLEKASNNGIFYNDPTSDKGFMIGFHGTNDMIYIGHTTNSWSTGSYLGVISGNGNVGIKTTSPSYELHIAGRTYSTVSSEDPAIRGENTIGGTCRGIRGEARGTSGEKYGTQGYATGAGKNYGVWGSAQGSATLNIAVYGNATGATTNWAGYFAGNINVTGSISKGSGSFLIDHPLDPLNKTLRHNFVESPWNMCVYPGKVKLDATGKAEVKMPEYYKALVKEDEAIAQITPVGRPFLTGCEWSEDFSTLIIYGEPDRDVYYTVMADRDDPVIHQLYKPVEEEKGNGNFTKGKLLYPKAYGYPEEMGEDYDKRHGE